MKFGPNLAFQKLYLTTLPISCKLKKIGAHKFINVFYCIWKIKWHQLKIEWERRFF